jgi:hypothetical protein
MGAVFANIELINAEEIVLARHHIIAEEEVKRMTIKIRVASGSDMLCINESIQEQMQFPVMEKRKAQLANGSIVECDVVSSVELQFKNRRSICNAGCC